MLNKNWNISSLQNAIVRPRTTKVLGARTFEAYEPILMFENADVSVTTVTGAQQASRGGKNNAIQIAWNSITDVSIALSKGKLSDIGLAILANAVVEEYTSGDAYYVNTSELKQLDTNGRCTLGNIPYVSNKHKMFAYVSTSSVELDKKDVSIVSGAEIEVAGGANLLVTINYYYDYDGDAKEIILQQGLLSGSYQLEGKTVIVDEDGEERSLFIVFPKIAIHSNLSIGLGPAQSPVYAAFEFTVLEDSHKGVKTPVYYVILDSEID